MVKVTLDEEFEKMRNTHEHKRQKTLYYWEKVRAYVQQISASKRMSRFIKKKKTMSGVGILKGSELKKMETKMNNMLNDDEHHWKCQVSYNS